MFAIFGSGFGLYGYLPALVEICGERVVLPARYRPRFASRLELQRFATAIEWVADESEALSVADGAVLALSPGAQVEIAANCLRRSNIRRMILEKPLAPDPAAAIDLLEALVRSGKIFRIGYNFRHTGWAERLATKWRRLSASDCISIQWSFLAHHFRHGLHGWKRHAAEGGGALKFFGIHVIAFLAELGYERVEWSKSAGQSGDEVEKWAARLAGPDLPDCEVCVDSRSDLERFAISLKNGTGASVIVDLRTPFDGSSVLPAQAGELDGRVGVVGAVCRSVLEPGPSPHEWYRRALELWRQAESKAGPTPGRC